MFPEAFGVLVLGKTYSIARSATVPRLVPDETRLVKANAFLARVALIGSAIGGATAALGLESQRPDASAVCRDCALRDCRTRCRDHPLSEAVSP